MCNMCTFSRTAFFDKLARFVYFKNPHRHQVPRPLQGGHWNWGY